MSDSTSTVVSNALSERPTKPEQFYFCVEMNEDEPIVTICPIAFWDENKFMDVDDFNEEITEFLEEKGFFAILASSYENESDTATLESVTQQMIEMGFKQNAEFDEYIASTEVDFNEFQPDSVGTYSSEDEKNNSDVDSEDFG
jgi:hypothetical protein